MSTINFDGVGHEVDSMIATLISKDRQKYDSQIESLKETNQSLADEKTQLNSQVEKLQGELDATKTKLSELENMDNSGLVADCISAWEEVLPSIKAKYPQFDVDYSLSPVDIRRTYLKAVHNKENIFDESDDYVSGAYDHLKPDAKTSGNLAKNKVNQQFDRLQNIERMDGSGFNKAREEMTSRRKNRKVMAYGGDR